jgi:hypothetical protein
LLPAPRQPRPRRARPVETAASLALLLTIAGLLTFPGAAHAGAYTIYQCRDFGGNAYPLSPRWNAYGSVSAFFNSCSPGGAWGAGAPGPYLPANTQGGISIAAPAGAPNLTLVSVQLNAGSGGGPWSGSHMFFRIFSAGQLLQDGPIAPFSRYMAQTLPAGARDLTFDEFCSTDGSTNCYTNDPSHSLSIGAFALTLSESVNPSAAAAGGTLLSGDTVSGSRTLAYTVTDADSGPISATVKLGTTQVASDSFASSCSYSDFSPCAQSRTQTDTIDTTRVADGAYPLSFTVTDAAGNTATVAAGRTVTVDNVPPPSITAAPSVAGAPRVGSSLAGEPGSWTGSGVSYAFAWQRCSAAGGGCQAIPGATARSYTIAPADAGSRLRFLVTATNSEGSSQAVSELTESIPAESAPAPAPAPAPTPPPQASRGDLPAASTVTSTAPGRLEAVRGRGRAVRVPYGAAATVEGQLTGPDGRPLGDVAVRVFAQVAAPGEQQREVGALRTDSDGRFAFTAEPGPGRTLQFVYERERDGSRVEARLDVDVEVGAAARLTASRRRVRRGRGVAFAGQLLGGPFPADGVPVFFEGRVGRAWRVFARTRSDAQGRFRTSYRFPRRGPAATYPIRAAVAPGAAGYPYVDGVSNTVRVTTRR